MLRMYARWRQDIQRFRRRGAQSCDWRNWMVMELVLCSSLDVFSVVLMFFDVFASFVPVCSDSDVCSGLIHFDSILQDCQGTVNKRWKRASTTTVQRLIWFIFLGLFALWDTHDRGLGILKMYPNGPRCVLVCYVWMFFALYLVVVCLQCTCVFHWPKKRWNQLRVSSFNGSYPGPMIIWRLGWAKLTCRIFEGFADKRCEEHCPVWYVYTVCVLNIF